MMEEENAKKYRKSELRKLLKEAFKHYKENTLFKEELYQYFKEKGWKENEIDEIVRDALRHHILEMGVSPIPDPKNPLEIIEDKIVYTLKRKEKWTKIS